MCNESENCIAYQKNIGNPYVNICDRCAKNISDYDRGFKKGYETFYERINDYLDTHGTNERLIRQQLNTVFNELS
jgi:hypothetical protein